MYFEFELALKFDVGLIRREHLLTDVQQSNWFLPSPSCCRQCSGGPLFGNTGQNIKLRYKFYFVQQHQASNVSLFVLLIRAVFLQRIQVTDLKIFRISI